MTRGAMSSCSCICHHRQTQVCPCCDSCVELQAENQRDEAEVVLDKIRKWADPVRESVAVDKAGMYKAGFFDAQAEIRAILAEDDSRSQDSAI